MRQDRSLSHSRWECKYHVVFIPKYRRKTLFGFLHRELGEVFRRLAEQKESAIEEGHLMSDHVHMMISIPPRMLNRSRMGGARKSNELGGRCNGVQEHSGEHGSECKSTEEAGTTSSSTATAAKRPMGSSKLPTTAATRKAVSRLTFSHAGRLR